MSSWALYVVNSVFEIEGKSYLEIGVSWGRTFLNVNARRRVGVDPLSSVGPPEDIRAVCSDEFFSTPDPERFDIIFVDGDHEHRQVLRDFNSSIDRLAPGGIIILHDMVPPHRCYATEPHCGSAYKLYPALCEAYRGSILTLQPFPHHDYHSYTGDFGLTVVFSPEKKLPMPKDLLAYDEFLKFALGGAPPFVSLDELLAEVKARTTPPAAAASSASAPAGAGPS